MTINVQTFLHFTWKRKDKKYLLLNFDTAILNLWIGVREKNMFG